MPLLHSPQQRVLRFSVFLRLGVLTPSPDAQPLCYQNHWVLQTLFLSSFLVPSVPAFLQGQPKPLPQLLLLMLQDLTQPTLLAFVNHLSPLAFPPRPTNIPIPSSSRKITPKQDFNVAVPLRECLLSFHPTPNHLAFTHTTHRPRKCQWMTVQSASP